MSRERILVGAQTYPVISSKHEQIVCVAGFREDGSLVWVYPLPARANSENAYKKFQILDIELKRSRTDFRKESFQPRTPPRRAGSLPARKTWGARKAIVLSKVYTNLETLLAEAREKDPQRRTSLAVFRPVEIKEFIIKKAPHDWGREKLDVLRQTKLFSKKSAPPEVVRKIPFQFYYRFTDSHGRKHQLMVQDADVGDCFWRAAAKTGDEKRAAELVRERFLFRMPQTCDIYFILGTMLQFQAKNAPNPFVIVGVFAPPKDKQLSFAGF